MNKTIIRMTARGMLGGRRSALLIAVALLVVGIALLVRTLGDIAEPSAASLLQGISFAAFVPLVGLIVGTGAIAPEIDDGSIVHLLSKPVSRHVIIFSKLAVAVGAAVVFAVVPTVAAAVVLGMSSEAVLAFGAGTLAAAAVYTAAFLLLAVVTRHAVTIGLVYALVWESLVGSFVFGARNLSVQQWALSVTERLAPDRLVTSDVGFGLACTLIGTVFVAAAWYAGTRLRSLTLVAEE